MIKIFNDVHADPDLMKRILNLKIDQGDILVANGDFFGGRGPITNKIVKVYYEVRRGEAPKYELQELISAVIDEPIYLEQVLIFNSVHSGTFLAELCRRNSKFRAIVEDETRQNLVELDRISKNIERQGGKLVYLPGNCEITISDFDITSGVHGEKTLPPKKRFFNRLAAEGAFSSHGTEYVNQLKVIEGNTLLIPIDFLDEWIEERIEIPDSEDITQAIVHYPPFNQNVVDCFHRLFGFTVNAMDNVRMYAVSEILDHFPNLKVVVFGHIHPGISKESTEKLPTSVVFQDEGRQLIWNCPGNVFAFN